MDWRSGGVAAAVWLVVPASAAPGRAHNVAIRLAADSTGSDCHNHSDKAARAGRLY